MSSSNPTEGQSPAVEHVEVDPEDDVPNEVEDGGYSTDIESYTTSLSASVFDYKWINGRRFHAYREGSYKFPNDEREQDRLDMIHYVFKTAMDGKLFLAPVNVEQPLQVLDLGTGTGIWALEVGDQYPDIKSILGNDLSPIQPTMVPPNVSFEVDDIESEWPPRQPFDLIHGRYLCGSIQDWPKLFKQAYEQTRIGGWIEFQDFHLITYSQDGTLTPDNKIYKWFEYLREACDIMGRPATVGAKLPEYAAAAGFSNIHHRIYPLPLGSWPKEQRLKEAGALNILQFLEGIEACSVATFTHVLGWSLEAVEVFLAEVRADALKKGAHLMQDFHVVYAQRLE
ncbi:S-adenosyl-L-methionine-dependent methyltransferase [Aspergillus sclerotioniger CBS 115572]|uniref:S-adenosyl-L-methionine-dependent methyltransferase n=1 Tax=Aspergillus sclerotioniger CBS 115572 TaxID=1450535 RepID=A0A317XE57_9EURO|nr:S-adenosyl-L-methionine-dependent methyltransferase [Aspergillus sclerotioniger CBS 115572]PWY95907.1 S-adenosyl-L-methionine-dependent methyltransferase [Aspergillus sclerotioniger CBS 115572]